MYKSNWDLSDYLPLRNNDRDSRYIDHLKQVFSVLESVNAATKEEDLARPFSIMPFHLLFMMAVQSKVLRIYKELPEKYMLAFTIKKPQNGKEDVLTPNSPKEIALLAESEIISFLKIAGLPDSEAKGIVASIIRYRNNSVAHAKCEIESNLESKVNEYFCKLDIIQKAYKKMNENVARNWLNKIEADKDIGDIGDIGEFFENHLSGSYLCPCDLGDVVGIFLKSKKINLEQLNQAVNKGLELAYDQTVQELKVYAVNGADIKRRFNSIKLLDENGELNGSLKKQILKKKTNPAILALL